ncbi:hypothetical protein [Streptomyces sp. NPDC054787]
MAFDPQFQALYDQRAAQGARPLYDMTLAEARAADPAAVQADAGAPEPVREVVEKSIPGPAGPLLVRIYRPVAVPGPSSVLVPAARRGRTVRPRLRDSDVPVESTRYPGVAHGFFAMAGALGAGSRALKQAAAYLRTAFAGDSTEA